MSQPHSDSPREGWSFVVRSGPLLAAVPFTIVADDWVIVLLAVLVLLAVSPGLRQLFAELLKALREIRWGSVKLLFR